MNNLIVDIIPLKVDRLLVESSIKSGGPLVVEGIIQRAGVKNHNGRIYEREILAREMEKYMEGPIATNNALGELDHPDSSVINLNNVSHKINKCWWNGNDVHGQIEILPTPSGNIAKKRERRLKSRNKRKHRKSKQGRPKQRTKKGQKNKNSHKEN